jgi:four helix bundle protein
MRLWQRQYKVFHRASLSVVLNLAEGSGKRTERDRKRFYSIAYGSIRDVQAILDITFQKKSMLRLSDMTAAHIFKLIKNPGSGA